MPLLGNELADYGYEAENRAFTRAFADDAGKQQEKHNVRGHLHAYRE